MTILIILIIICKGTRKNGQSFPCNFLYTGKWGDVALMEHEKLHRDDESENKFWLGFDTPQDFGKYSGRDGKRE